MKAAIIEQFGKADQLKVADRPLPVAGRGEVLIRVKAAGLNPVDTKIRAGTHISCKDLTLPAILGKEVSGIVVEAGEEAGGLLPGDEVFAFLPSNGGFAQYVAAPSQWVIRKPANVSFETAAAASLAGLTAYQAIHAHLELDGKERVLIQAAAGGVGHLAVQLAKRTGAHVSGTASDRNHDFLVDLGVDQVINYKTERFEEKASGVDAVLDAMGGEVLYRSIAYVKPGGRVVCLPSATRDDPRAVALANGRNVQLIWPMMKPDRDQLQQLARLLEQNKLHVEVSRTFPLEEIVAAHRAVESHRTRGKLALVVEP